MVFQHTTQQNLAGHVSQFHAWESGTQTRYLPSMTDWTDEDQYGALHDFADEHGYAVA